MSNFDPGALEAAARQREVRLTTRGRRSGKPRVVTIWVATDGDRMYIRSGGGVARQWPQNLMESGEGSLELDGQQVRFRARHIDRAQARDVSGLYRSKYGPTVRASGEGQPPTLGETATFELSPATP